MLNIMRADLYKIFRGKGIYITGIILFAILNLQLFTNGTIGIGTGIISDAVGEPLAVTGANAPLRAIQDTDVLLYFLLPLIIFIASADFSTGTVKNVLSNGISRTKYYLSKLILSCMFCIALLVVNIAVPMIMATIFKGFGGEFNISYVISILKPFLLQLFMFLAMTCFGVFLVFSTKRTAAVNGIYIAWLLVPLMIIMMLMQLSENFSKLAYYDITLNVKMLANFDIRSTEDIIRAFLIGTFYILASTIGGIFVFKRSEIK